MAFIKNSKIILALIVFLALCLRIFNLGSNPPALYWDEASLGYNAYAISETGRDEHGEFLPYSRFIAFGDYKPPVYIYSAAPLIKLLGLSEFSIRLPSSLAGVGLTLVTFFLVLEIFATQKYRSRLGLLASFLVAVSPWSLQLSRAAFEANIATFLSCLGILFFLKFFQKFSYKLLLLSSIFLVLPLYTFNSHRLAVPLLAGLILVLNLRRSLPWKKLLLFGLLSLILVLPLAPHVLSKEGSLRFQEVTWLNDLDPIVLSNSRVATDGGSLVGKLIHNRRVVYGQEFLYHFFDHLTPTFLFFSGDENPKLSIQKVGELYWFDLFFLIPGLIFLLKGKFKTSVLVLGWWAIGIIPASFARETPHALRSIASLPMPQIISALGLIYLLTFIKRFKLAWISLTLVIFLLFFGNYLTAYYIWYPKAYASAWQAGYKDMAQKVALLAPNYAGVSVTTALGRPYIYFLLYTKVLPHDFLKNSTRTRDWFGLWSVSRFNNLYFDDSTRGEPNWLYVRVPGSEPNGAVLISTITDLTGKPVFTLSTK